MFSDVLMMIKYDVLRYQDVVRKDNRMMLQHDLDPNSARAICQTDTQTAKPTSNPNQSKTLVYYKKVDWWV